MNVIDAIERLRILNNGVTALNRAIDDAHKYEDAYGKYALRVILDDVEVERDELERKLSGVQI